MRTFKTLKRFITQRLFHHSEDTVISLPGGKDVAQPQPAQAELQWDLSVNEAIAKLSKALIDPHFSVEEISELVLEPAKRLTHSRHGYVGYIDQKTGYLVATTLTKDVWKQCEMSDKDIVFEKFRGLWGWVLQNNEPLMTNSPTQDPRSSGLPKGHIAIERFLSAPSLIGNTVVGQVSVANSSRDYNETDLAFIKRLAEVYALAIHHKWSEENLQNALSQSRQHSAETTGLLEASRSVLRNREFQDAARAIFDSCKNLTGATAGYVALLSEDEIDNTVLFLDAGGRTCSVDPNLPMPVRGLRAQTYSTGKAVYDNNFADSDWMKWIPEGHVRLDNVLFAPLTIEDKVVGLLGLANKPGGFCDNDARMATAFGELASVALHNSRTLESLEKSEQRLKAANEQLRRREKEVSALAEFPAENPYPVLRISRDCTILYANKASSAVLETWERQVGQRLPEPCCQRIEEAFSSDTPYRFEFSSKNDRIFLVTLAPIADAGYVNVYGLDITELKEAEKALLKARDELEIRVRERTTELANAVDILQEEIGQRMHAEETLRDSEEKYRELVENANSIIMRRDIEGNITFFNEFAQKFFGYTEDEIIGKNVVGTIVPYRDSSGRELAEMVLDIGRKPELYETNEHENIRKNGEHVWIAWTNKAIRNKGGNVVEILCVGSDITERRHLEKQVLRISEEEQRRIGQDLHDGLQQELVGTAFECQILKQKLAAGRLPEVADVEKITELLERAIEHTRDMASMLYPVSLDSSGLIVALQELAGRTESIFQVDCRFESNNLPDVGDPVVAINLYRIAQEAVTNAVKHGQPERITVSLNRQRGKIRLLVKDDGSGISTDITNSGGMGMQIMKYRAALIGASLNITNKTGGTEICVTCPFEHESNKQ